MNSYRRQTSAGSVGQMPYKNLIGVALVLLCNPMFNLLDVLPDVLAYIFLAHALQHLAWFDESFGEGRRLLKRMAWINGLQMVLMLWAYSLNSFERPTMILTLTLSLAIARCVTVIPALTQIFRGLSYLGMRHDGVEMFRHPDTLSLKFQRRRLLRQQKRWESLEEGEQKERCRQRIMVLEGRVTEASRRSARRDITARAMTGCCAFTVGKSVLTVLPELSALSWRVPGAFNWYGYIALFRTVSMGIVTVWGILWAATTIRYVRTVAKDAAFWQKMETEYEKDCCRFPAKRPRRDVAIAFSFVMAGSFFALNLTMDGWYIVPEFMLPVFFGVGFLFLRPYLDRKVFRRSLWLCGTHTCLSAGIQIWLALILTGVDITKIDRSEEIYAVWCRALGLTAVRAMALALPLVALGLVLMNLIRAGVGKGSLTLVTKNPGGGERRLVYTMLASGGAGAVAHVGYLLLRPRYGFAWIPDVLLSALFILMVYRTTSSIKDALSYEKLLGESEVTV